MSGSLREADSSRRWRGAHLAGSDAPPPHSHTRGCGRWGGGGGAPVGSPQRASRGNHFATTNSIRSGIKVYAGRRSETTLAFSLPRSLLFSRVSQGIESPAERLREKIVPLTSRYTT